MIELTEKPFNARDAEALLGNSTENIKTNITIEMLKAIEQKSDSRTWWYKNNIIGCGGILIYEAEKCEAWSIINKELSTKFKRELLVFAKRFLNQSAQKHKIKYMKATWRTDFSSKIKWLEHLGFVKESGIITLENGDTSYIYSRSFQWD